MRLKGGQEEQQQPLQLPHPQLEYHAALSAGLLHLLLLYLLLPFQLLTLLLLLLLLPQHLRLLLPRCLHCHVQPQQLLLARTCLLHPHPSHIGCWLLLLSVSHPHHCLLRPCREPLERQYQ